MSIKCPSCGSESPDEAKFCSNCGTKLAAADGAPPARRTPTSDGMRAERRQLTVMFCDIAGSTKLSEQLDPEDLMEVVRRYQAACAEVIERFGGSIAQYLGDGLLVYFGYPTAYENAPERAARAGLEILDALDALNRGLLREFNTSLKLRLGIHTGLVVIGEVGAGSKREQLAVGDTANIAARLEGLARPNTGVVSDATRELIRGLFETESLGEQALKGIATPMEVHRLLRVSETRSRRVLTPFVGRERELAAMRERWTEAGQGRGSATLLVADAGVGKSRMIPAFKDALVGAYRLHEAYCSPFFVNSVLHPVVEMLRVQTAIGRDDAGEAALGKLRAWLAGLPGEVPDALPLLAGLLGIPPRAGYEDLELSPQARKLRLNEALLACLLTPAVEVPTLIIVEDMHWVDPSTLDLIEQLIARLPEHRAALLMTARPNFESPWAAVEHVHAEHLRPFGEQDTTALVLAMTEGHNLPPRMLAQLVSRTDGIPLFVEELTRMLMDAGQIEDTKASAIPTTLHDSLMARLDRLQPLARKVAQLGATIGRGFPHELLRRIFSGTDEELSAGLEQLLDSQLIYREGGGTPTYTFKHALIQDTAYESLLKRTRQEYHARIARALSEGSGGLGEAEPELLAQHLGAAGRPHHEAAARQWLRAGEQAQASSSNQEAVSHFQRGLALLDAVSEEHRLQLEVSLLSKLGTTLSAIKGYAADEVEQAYARAHALCNRLGQTPERFWVLWGLWAFYLVKGVHSKGVHFAELMLELARSQDDEGLLLEAEFSLGLSFFFMGDDLPRARKHLERVVDRYDADRHHGNALLTGQDVGVTSHSVSALVHFQLGEIDVAVQRHEQALALSERLGHSFSRAYALGCAAWFQLYMRDHESSQRHAQAAVELSQEQSFGWWLVWGMILGGSAGVGLGAPQAAAQIEQGLALWRQTGSGFTVPYFLGLLFEARRAEALDPEGIEALLDEASRLAEDNHERFFSAELARLRGELALGRGDESARERADEAFGVAMSTAASQGAHAWALRAATARARLLKRRGQPERGRELLAGAHAAFTDQPAIPDVVEARELLRELEG